MLVSCLEWLWRDPSELGGANREDFFMGANLTIYFSREQLKNRDYRGPDFFLVTSRSVSPHTRGGSRSADAAGGGGGAAGGWIRWRIICDRSA
ncbi:MAG: hypothetical protein HC771_14955 [Synechococcales cyanobacterium CRU_2_2]|nr:hypothetical protein [Synechococcales cyanobacterium CRU_2_2]